MLNRLEVNILVLSYIDIYARKAEFGKYKNSFINISNVNPENITLVQKIGIVQEIVTCWFNFKVAAKN